MLWLPLQAHAEEPVIVRTSITPESNIWVGQQIILQLDILALDGWADSKRLPEFDVPGAYLLRVESQGTRLSETISGGSYSGQRHEWLLFPQRGGDFRIQPTEIEARVRRFGSDTGEQSVTLKTAALEFTVEIPPGAENISGLISTTELTATQSWQPDVKKMRAGDGVKRTISFRAANVSGMAFTPLKPEAVANLAIYPGEPDVFDQINRGILEYGKRVETFTYVAEKAGEYQIPDITISWWDIKQQKLHSEKLKGISLSVSKASAGSAPGIADATSAGQHLNWIYLLLLGVVLTALLFLWQRRLSPAWKRHQAEKINSEPASFRRFTETALKGDPDETMATLMQWLDKLQLVERPARLKQFMEEFGDDAGRRQTEKFTAAFSERNDDGWSTRELITAMETARRNYLDRLKAAGEQRHIRLLQPLNP
ncbi:MAG: BatD family protein [Pseudomonadota bacterium]|nr:BatD family protein [Pseudomonadota bacterium]